MAVQLMTQWKSCMNWNLTIKVACAISARKTKEYTMP